MKFTAPIVLALAAAANALSSDDNVNIATCKRQDPNIMKAIYDFCHRGGGEAIMVPSFYANRGKTYGHTKVWVKGDGCKPAQWLPEKYCHQQFHQVCGFGFGGGYGQSNFGKNGCQKFIIQQV